MSDFTHEAWGIYIAVITLASIVACAVLLRSLSTRRVAKGGQVGTTHTWDEDLTEWNNPLPRWWIWLFYSTIVFSLLYLVLYPGLGSFAGYFGWSSSGQYENEQKMAAAKYGPLFERFLEQDMKVVAADPEARQIGQRLFLTYCAQCHGSDAGGSRGFPSLTDHDWLHEYDLDTIKDIITNGRVEVMPPMASAVGGDEGVKDVVHYVLSLAGRTHDSLRAFRGKSKFAAICAACHGADGKGNKTLGAPNLTDDIWLYGGSEAAIAETVARGRGGVMPAHKGLLDEGKIHVLTAYIYSLSAEEKK
ncbi:MAG: cytochrome-c oxidase, cbb3-type subunit III [Betaproteobacteria bacterium RIFCSPLOWO2_12_FULL_62_58]|nr:MAG: cytochrome-c oxidase, cbb3-type subunit III [Betaproteobacteria bacterium RIFCSPLOWO2_02_FULL_62_79]OGA53646.1 MAG: cytochrome-c oxidase, cbb3-type subunit III [Betaproteobacteria bacterium RIFCSPLOWO2_12_FULL_62_58]